MAYVSKDLKAKAVANLKVALKGKNIKYSVAVRNHSTLVLTITKSDIDFIGNANAKSIRDDNRDRYTNTVRLITDGYTQTNEYYLDKSFDGESLEVLETIKQCLLTDEFFDHSDSQSDYFHRSHYISINIGKYDTPFEVLTTPIKATKIKVEQVQVESPLVKFTDLSSWIGQLSQKEFTE